MGRYEPEEFYRRIMGSDESVSAKAAEWHKRKDLAEIADSGRLLNSLSVYKAKKLMPPPSLPATRIGLIGTPLVGAIEIYIDSLLRSSTIPPGWERFERELAYGFAWLIMILAYQPEKEFQDLGRLFLQNLPRVKLRRGRPRKAVDKMADSLRGGVMLGLWKDEVLEAWNVKTSMERLSRDPRRALESKGFRPVVINAVLARRATPESSVAKVYSETEHVSKGRARNALRAYLKGRKLTELDFIYRIATK